ncbi:MAG: hypothetical protein IPJ19_07055 [Planctomycetes bacterium]|nr:hypothetical protein [Planctomycetota bacterium]
MRKHNGLERPRITRLEPKQRCASNSGINQGESPPAERGGTWIAARCHVEVEEARVVVPRIKPGADGAHHLANAAKYLALLWVKCIERLASSRFAPCPVRVVLEPLRSHRIKKST